MTRVYHFLPLSLPPILIWVNTISLSINCDSIVQWASFFKHHYRLTCVPAKKSYAKAWTTNVTLSKVGPFKSISKVKHVLGWGYNQVEVEVFWLKGIQVVCTQQKNHKRTQWERGHMQTLEFTRNQLIKALALWFLAFKTIRFLRN